VQLATPERRATATAIPAPPLPTATATATPTPVVHVVQKGDNLLAIAYQYDVSVQTLIEANEIENPRALQVGQELIIPADDASALAVQLTATPTPMPLRIVHLAFHRTPAGSTWCMGEVQNDRGEPLDMVQLQVSLYNVNGELAEQVTSFTVADIITGHGAAPFAILIPSSVASFANYEVTVIGAEPIFHWGNRHTALIVDQVQGEAVEGAFIVSGVVHNAGQANAHDVRVTLTAYGEEDTIVGVRQLELPRLDAGEHQPFSLSLIPAAPAKHVKAVVWGMKKGD
jgi:LysM repeat protein